MRVTRVDHINIAGPLDLLDRCVAFYTEVLGLTVGARPSFRSRGYWLYAGDVPIVHLTETSAAAASTGALNHVAFACEGAETVLDELRARGIEFTVSRVEENRQFQVFVRDPAGVRLELNFREA